jgi:hypothetical protein
MMHYHCSHWLAKVQLTEINFVIRRKVNDISCRQGDIDLAGPGAFLKICAVMNSTSKQSKN